MGLQGVEFGLGRADPIYPYGVNVSLETTTLQAEHSKFKSRPRYVYCTDEYKVERKNTLIEYYEQQRPTGICLYRATECTMPQVEGTHFCENHQPKRPTKTSHGE